MLLFLFPHDNINSIFRIFNFDFFVLFIFLFFYFQRAHTVLTRCLAQAGSPSSSSSTPSSLSTATIKSIGTDSTYDPSDCLPKNEIEPKQLLTILCEESEPPPFSTAAKTERALRKNTMESLDFDGLEI